MKEFPGVPVVRTQLFHWCGPDSVPQHRTKILQAGGTEGKKKKKNERNKLKNPMPWNLGQSISVKVKKFIYHSLQPSVAHWLKFILPQLTFPSFWVLSPYKSRFLWAVVCGPLWHFIQDSNLFCTSGYQTSVFTVTDNLLHYKLSS